MSQNLLTTVILAGGLATRLRPLTETIPKCLLEINGKPFIDHQLHLLRKNGIKKVILCLGYLGEMVVNYVRDGSQFDLSVTYSFDGSSLLGTGGAIKKALSLLDDHFFVLYGDSYLPCAYDEVQSAFMQNGKLALMTVFRNQGLWDTSNVEFKNGEILLYDKEIKTREMQYIDYGLGIFSKSIFEKLPTNQPFDLATLYQDLLAKGQLAGCEVTQRFYEVGSFAGIEELSYHLVHFVGE